MINRTLLVVGVASLLCASASPRAQDQEPPPAVLQFGYVDGDDNVQITVGGDDVTVLLNGEPMPESRWQREGDRIVCRDQHGRRVAQLMLQVAGGAGGTLQTLTRAKPRLLLGVSLVPPAEALAAHLGINADEAVCVAEVSPDGAAAEAGLQLHDVVVAIDDESPATQDRLRAVLDLKQPGESLALTILRQGQRQEIEVPLRVEFADTAEGAPTEFLPYLGDPARYLNSIGYRFDTKFPQSLQLPVTSLGLLAQRYRPLVAGADPQDAEMRKHLEALQQRLESLEKLLGALDRKLK